MNAWVDNFYLTLWCTIPYIFLFHLIKYCLEPSYKLHATLILISGLK